jgi:F-type H+-transporting ATPase subunit a
MSAEAESLAYHYSWFFEIPGVAEGAPLAAIHNAGVPGAHDELANFHVIPAAWLVFLGITALAFMARSGLVAARGRGGTEQYVPDAGLGPRNLMELVVEGLLNFMGTILHSREQCVKHLPLVGTIFLYILGSNLLGLIPGFLPPSSSMSNNLAMALVVFLVFNYEGIKEHGVVGYAKTLAGPIPALAIPIFAVETFSLLIRPLTLSVRLYINMFADHLLLGVFTDLTVLIIPSALIGLGTFVAFVQAFVFMLLTVVYIALATSHDH